MTTQHMNMDIEHNRDSSGLPKSLLWKKSSLCLSLEWQNMCSSGEHRRPLLLSSDVITLLNATNASVGNYASNVVRDYSHEESIADIFASGSTEEVPTPPFEQTDDDVDEPNHFVHVCIKHSDSIPSPQHPASVLRDIGLCIVHCKNAVVDGGASMTNTDFVMLVLLEVESRSGVTELEKLFASKPAHITFQRRRYLLSLCAEEVEAYLEEQLKLAAN